MKTLNILFIYLVSFSLFAQTAQQEIDEQIWKPFTSAWEANDATSFNAIHSDDVRRINRGKLMVGKEYKNRNREQMQGQVSNRTIEFTFDTRSANGIYAYEVGYFRISQKTEGKPNYFIGRFHVALKKIDGVWKITQDWDTGEINGVKITPESVENREFIHF
jgi:ketosteroid isomerase-like protein